MKCRFVNGAPVLIHNFAAATHLYRIAQEAIGNAIKHGRAKSIEVNLSLKADTIALLIRDDGTGFARRAGNGPGMGLRIMRYRAGMMGASLEVEHPPAGGVTVLCSLPQTANTPPSSIK